MPRSARNEGLPRRRRFSTQGSFGPVLRSGRKVRGELAVLHFAPSTGVARLGVALTKKLVRSAVHRNRVKRGIREAFRRHAARESGLDCVITLRERVDAGRIPKIVDEVRVLLGRLPASPA